jgi:hypothetical protein
VESSLKKLPLLELDLGSGNKPRAGYQGIDIGGDRKIVFKKDAVIF